MDSTDLTRQTATDLIRQIHRGDLSAVEVVQAHIDRLQAVNPRLNALVAQRFDLALQEAKDVDQRQARGQALGPLAGLPVTVKDSIDLQGFASTYGLPWRARELASADDPHIARLRRQGAIVLGKSNVAQLLTYIESDNPLFGRTLNPWNLERTCGGSSGGEAALVAACASPLGIGTDIGGSVRIPAHFCGIASLKPSSGRCPDHGRFSVPTGLLAIQSQLGPMARSVADLELAYQHMQAPPAECGLQPSPASQTVSVAQLRVGFYEDDSMLPVAPAIRRAVREAALALQAAGVTVVPIQPPPLQEGFELGFGLMAADGGALLRTLLHGGPVHPTNALLLRLIALPAWLLRMLVGLTQSLGQKGMADAMRPMGRTSVREHWLMVQQLQDWRLRFAQSLSDRDGKPLDALICPPCSLPALRHGSSFDLGLAGPHSVVFNALGWPAGVLPWTEVQSHETSDRRADRDRVAQAARRCEADSTGLPVGVQVVARPWAEHHVLALMQALQTAQPRALLRF